MRAAVPLANEAENLARNVQLVDSWTINEFDRLAHAVELLAQAVRDLARSLAPSDPPR